MSHEELVQRLEALNALVMDVRSEWCSIREQLPAEDQNGVGMSIQELDYAAGRLLIDVDPQRLEDWPD